MKVADYTTSRRSPLRVRVSYASAVDLLGALWLAGSACSGEGRRDIDLGEGWIDDFARELSADTKKVLEDLCCGDLWISLMPMLPELGDGSTVEAFIGHLAGLEAADLRYRIIQLYEDFDDAEREIVADAAEGVEGAVDALLSLDAFADEGKKHWRETLRYLLSMPPSATQELIVGVLRDAQRTAFERHEEAFRPHLEADYRSKRSMERRISGERLVEIATNGIEFAEEHATRPIVLIPSMVTRPWVVFAAGPDYLVLAYPVADEHLTADGDAPPAWLVKLHKALGDERRLWLLRALAQGDASLAELAERADVGKSTLHHHLMLLRAAGLVRVRVGGDKRYALRKETVADVAAGLDHYVYGPRRREDTT